MRGFRYAAAAIVVAAVLGGAVAIKQNLVTFGPGSQPTTLVMSGFELDGNPSAAANYRGNQVIVLGTVDTYTQARWNTQDLTSPMRSIYTPVVVRVETVLRGSVGGTTVTVRVFGGQIGNVVQTVAGDLPKLGDVPTGRRVLLFLSQLTALDDSSKGYTVNQVYSVDASGTVTSSNGHNSTTLSTFTRLVKSSSASAAP